MGNKFGCANWEDYIPQPICDDFPQYSEFYKKTWELAYNHIKNIPGMPQTPYMDEAFCDSQVWIWDSCFMSLFCKYAKEVFPGVETLNNFYEVLYNGKSLPEIIPTENEPKWTGAVPGKKFSIKVHLADNPPLFAWAEYENALMSGDKSYIKELLYERKVLQKHYEWFESLKSPSMLPNVSNPTCLIAEEYGYRWEGGCSGMDNTPRGRKGERAEKERPNNPDMLWIDAICQQALSAEIISKLFQIIGDTEQSKEWHKRYQAKKDIINRFYWDTEDKFYYDIDLNTHEFYKVKTPASFWALIAGVATEEQAEQMVKYVEDPQVFGGKIPLVSLARNDADYSSTGDYWRGALWLPTAYVALKGMAKYGYFAEAHIAAHKIFQSMMDTYYNYEPHTIWECYSPEESKPSTTAGERDIVRRDFCGWSALGPISIYIEYVLGFHTIDAFNKIVEWEMPDSFEGRIGIKNLRFGNIVTDIEAFRGICKVISNDAYTLIINRKAYSISAGVNNITVLY